MQSDFSLNRTDLPADAERQNAAIYPNSRIIDEGWSTRDIILTVACSVAIAANALFIGLTLAPIGASAAFVFFYKAFAVWTQLSNIALCAIAIITIVSKKFENLHRRNLFIHNLFQHLTVAPAN